jgi:hypothetical protein
MAPSEAAASTAPPSAEPASTDPATHWPPAQTSPEPQSASCAHPQRPVPTSQTGVGEPARHCDSFCAVHWTQLPAAPPVVWQSGSDVPGHATAAHWESLLHGRQVPAVALQIGVVPEQSALVTQPTHTLVARSQSGRAPEQSALPWHTTHSP